MEGFRGRRLEKIALANGDGVVGEEEEEERGFLIHLRYADKKK